MYFGEAKRFLQLIPSETFRKLCLEHGHFEKTRGFEPWEHLSILILAQVMKLDSLRTIQQVLGVKKSTMSDANRIRSSALFEDLCQEIFQQILANHRKLRKAYKKILALDSTECSLNGRLAKMPVWRRSKNSAKAKLHIVWNVGQEWIEDFRITAGKVADQTVARTLKLASGATYVFDRGYPDLGFWWKIMQKKSHFVTRLKKSTEVRVDHLRLQKTSQQKTGVLVDQTYKPSKARLYLHPDVPKNLELRHIVYKDPKTKRIFDFVTSNFASSAQKIADIYQSRWSVELLFRWLKQHLQLREPPYRNKNAIEIYLAVSVLIRLLLELYRRKLKFQGTAWDLLRHLLAALLRQGLMNSDPPTHPHPTSASAARLSI